MEKLSLYNITTNLDYINESLENPIQEDQSKIEELKSVFMSLLKEKTDSVVGFSESLDDYIELIDKRMKALEEIKKAATNKRVRFNQYILDCLDRLETSEIRGELSTISIPKPRKKVEITNQDLIPAEFIKQKTEYSIDKVAIKAALDLGEIIEGAALIDSDRSVKFKPGKKL